MAIQISGTEVISNSRGLNNIASVDATTAASISAAGVGGGGTYDFVASGAIASGDVVALNSNGTVSVISSVPTTIDPPTTTFETVFETARSEYISATYHSTAGKVVIAYNDWGNSLKGTAVVGTVTGTSISFGTPTAFSVGSVSQVSSTYDANANKIIIAYNDAGSSSRGYAIAGQVSSTSISFGSAVEFYSGNYFNDDQENITYDSNSNKIVIAYRDGGNSNYLTARVGTVSGTPGSISFGTAVVFTSSGGLSPALTFDTNSNKVVMAYQDFSTTPRSGKAIVGTVSGTSISFGSISGFDPNYPEKIAAVFDNNLNKVVVAYRDRQNSYIGRAVVGTVSGTSISFGSPVTYENAQVDYVTAAFDDSANSVVIAYRDDGNSYYGTTILGTVSGTSISFGTPLVFASATTNFTSAAFNSSDNKAVIAYTDVGRSYYGTGIVITTNSSLPNNDKWVGIAAEAISDSATGTVTIFTGTNDQQTGLTAGTVYYADTTGGLATSGTYKIGRAISATEILIEEGNA